MHTTLNDPLGPVVGRWTNLSASDRDREARRIVGMSTAEARIERPDGEHHRGYARLVDAALAGDPVAVGWLTDTHRPLLMARGRVLFDRDPSEWAAASLEVLLTAARYAQTSGGGPWMRRQVMQQITHRMRRLVTRELARRRVENTCDPVRLLRLEPSAETESHPQLTVAVDRMLGRLDAATSAGLQAVAAREPLTPVAAEHHLTPAALRQRLVRARRRLRPELAGFARSA